MCEVEFFGNGRETAQVSLFRAFTSSSLGTIRLGSQPAQDTSKQQGTAAIPIDICIPRMKASGAVSRTR